MARQNRGLAEEIILYAVSAAVSYFVLVFGFNQLDPNREATKKAQQRKKDIAKRLGRPLIETDSYEDIIACDVINPDEIDVTFDSIGGLEKIKQELHEMVILPLQRPNLFGRCKLLSTPKGVLLYGPPGTGKTLLAKAIAKEARAVFINAQLSNLMSKWFGDSQKLVTALFTLAYKLQPAIIFLDEVESFLSHRKSGDQEALSGMKTEFMTLWDGFATDQNARVLVLCATNRPEELDEAIMRRLPKAIEVGLPNCEERANIFRVILKDENVESNIDYNALAKLCDGYSGSDLKDLCKQAAYFPIRELLEKEKMGMSVSEETRPLRHSDLETVIKSSKTSKVAAREYSERRQMDAQAIVSSYQQGDVSVNDFLRLLAFVESVRRNASES